MSPRRRPDQLVSILVSAGAEPFVVTVEPEGMSYDFPAAGRVVLTFRGAGAMKFELGYSPGCVVVWRPSDTEVWAASQSDPTVRLIGGSRDNLAPGFDTGAPALDVAFAEWDHLPLPDSKER